MLQRLATSFITASQSLPIIVSPTSVASLVRSPRHAVSVFLVVITGIFISYATHAALSLSSIWLVLLAVIFAILVLRFSDYYASSIKFHFLLKILLLLVFFLLGYARYGYILQNNEFYLLETPQKNVRIIGIIEKITPKSGGGWRILLSVKNLRDSKGNEILLPNNTRFRLSRKKLYENLQPGDEVGGLANVFPLPHPVVPQLHSFARDLWFEDISAVGYFIKGPYFVGFDEVTQPFSVKLQRFVSHLRQQLYVVLVDYFDDETIAGFIYALMTGISSAIAPNDLDVLRKSGLAHILAVSGFHMAVVMGGLFWVIRIFLSCSMRLALLYPIKKIAASCSVLSGGFYLMLTDFSISATRAWIMTSIMFMAVLINKRAFQIHNIAIAGFLIVLLWPQSVFQPGFQMSFLIISAIIATHENGLLQKPQNNDRKIKTYAIFPFLHGITRYLRGLFFITVIATSVAAPIIMLHFKTLSTLSIIANLLVLPLLTFIIIPFIILGIMLLLAGSDFADNVLYIVEIGLGFILKLAHYMDSLGYASLVYPDADIFWLYVVIFLIILLCFARIVFHRLAIVFCLVSFIIALLNERPYARLLISPEHVVLAFRAEDDRYCASRTKVSNFVTYNWQKHLGAHGRYLVADCGVRFGDDFCQLQIGRLDVRIYTGRNTAGDKNINSDSNHRDCFPAKHNNQFHISYRWSTPANSAWHSKLLPADKGAIDLAFSTDMQLKTSFVYNGDIISRFLNIDSTTRLPWHN